MIIFVARKRGSFFFCWLFFVRKRVFFFFGVFFLCVFGCFLGCFCAFLGVFFVFRALARKNNLGLFFELSQAKPEFPL